MRGNYDEGTEKLARNNESPGFIIPREFIRSFLGRIQETKHLVRYTGKFVISGARYIGIPLYLISRKLILSFTFCELLNILVLGSLVLVFGFQKEIVLVSALI